MNQVLFTDHAKTRMAQRNVSEGEVFFVLQHGKETHCGGAILITCRRKDIPATKLASDEIRRLDGVTIVMNRTRPIILTVWRNRKQGLRHIRRKSKYKI